MSLHRPFLHIKTRKTDSLQLEQQAPIWVQGVWRVMRGDRAGYYAQLCWEGDYTKSGFGILLMQLASGFSVGFFKKVRVMSPGQLLVGEETP